MAKNIIVLLEDDWELMGNGSGNIAHLQYLPALFLMDISQSFGIKINFMVEVMQQIHFRKHASRDRNISIQSGIWDETVLMMKERGHDVQLHIHPQWHDASFVDGSFCVSSNWSLPRYSGKQQLEMIEGGIEYLSTLVRQVDPAYQVHTFKAGAWAMQPSEGVLEHLSQCGIKIIIAGGKGISYISPDFYADYSSIEEDTQPYYPDFSDICKVSRNVEPLVVLPLPYYHSTPGIIAAKVKMYMHRRLARNFSYKPTKPDAVRRINPMAGTMKSKATKEFSRVLSLDIASLSFLEFRSAIDQIMGRYCAVDKDQQILVVLQTHTKTYTGNWNNLRRCYAYIHEKYGDRITYKTFSDVIPMLGTTVRVVKKEHPHAARP